MSLDPVAFIRTQTQIKSPSAVPEIQLHMATEVTPLWQLTEDRLRHADLPPPYWAFAWPGGQGMARYILDHPDLVKGKRIVDFAAGSGVAAIAAMKAGAKQALAVDIDPLALEAIRLNAELNQVEVEIRNGVDLMKPFTKADIIFAGDICYQQSTSTSVTRWLRFCVEKGIAVYLADPGRAYVPEQGLEKLAVYEIPTSRDLEDQDSRLATVWRMEKLIE
ncbi:MAG: 50S ribosomal protein L11 methyltransferase [Alphaproteobacteria bacterium]|nr:50S ribosomal protein L11 methyltransferase [Alphaproteobacteria bacterium]